MRRRYTARQREQLIEAVRRGEPVEAAAKRLGVTASTAYHWMKGARRAAAQPQFARLVPSSSLVRPSLVVRVRGAAIRVEAGFDAELLRG